jgi:hypothetical protein
MSGRLDSATQAAAIVRVSEAIRFAPELRKHLDEVIGSPAFRGSQRSQEFLKHIVERALQGDFEELRERSIGVALFGKPASYDTSEDAVVRVTASDVRKRLLQYYGRTGAVTDFRIDLPPGSYIPEFRCSAPADVPAKVPVPETKEAAATKTDEATAPPHVLVRRPFPWRTVAILALVAQAASIVCWFAERRIPPRASHLNFISSAFRNTPGAMQVILGDDGLLLIEVLLDRTFTLQEYENLKYLSMPKVVEQKGLQQFWESLSTRQLTNLGNLQNAVHVTEDLRGRQWNVTIRQARQVNPRDLRSGNFLILGSSHTNPWASLFQLREANFQFEATAPGNWAVIRNRHPMNGEPNTYEVHQDSKTGKTVSYAQVSLVENNSRTGRVLQVAGQSTSATELAGDFLLREDSVGKVVKTLGLSENSPLPDLEMVLRVTDVNEVGDSVELVACRKLSGHVD